MVIKETGKKFGSIQIRGESLDKYPAALFSANVHPEGLQLTVNDVGKNTVISELAQLLMLRGAIDAAISILKVKQKFSQADQDE